MLFADQAQTFDFVDGKLIVTDSDGTTYECEPLKLFGYIHRIRSENARLRLQAKTHASEMDYLRRVLEATREEGRECRERLAKATAERDEAMKHRAMYPLIEPTTGGANV